MRKIVNIAVLAAAVLFVSCEKTPDPVFPEVQEFGECESGDTFEFTFEANLPWKLVSDKPLWCKFETPAGPTRDISGKAGTIIVKVIITSDGIGNDPGAPASILLTMGEETKVIGEVSRKPLGYDLKVFDTDGKEITVIEAGYGNYKNFYVEANFRFAAVEWNRTAFDLRGNSIYGNRGDRVAGGVMLINDGTREKNSFSEDAGYKIIFSDENGDHTFEFPVIYKGMGSEDISFTTPGEGVNWEVTADGETFTQNNIVVNDGYSFTVNCRNDSYEVLLFSGSILPSDLKNAADDNGESLVASWLTCSKNGGNATLTVSENTDEEMRTAEVWVFPAALYERLGDTPLAAYNAIHPAEGQALEVYENALRIYNKCFVMKVTQAAAVPTDGIVKPMATRTDLGRDPKTAEQIYARDLKVTRIYDEDILNKYSVPAAYTVTYTTAFFLFPNIDGWTMDNFDAGDGSGEAEQWTGNYRAQVKMYYKDRMLSAAGQEQEYDVFEITRETGLPGLAGFCTTIYGPNDGWKDSSDPENWVYAVYSVSARKKNEGTNEFYYEVVNSKLVIIKGPSSNNPSSNNN